MSDFNEAEDLNRAIELVKQLAEDAIFGRLIELPGYGESNLLHPDNDRLAAAAVAMDPRLKEHEEMLQEFEDGISRDENIHAQVSDALEAVRYTYFQMGLLLGARLADASGQTFNDLSRAWIRATLAQPRHLHLVDPDRGSGDRKRQGER